MKKLPACLVSAFILLGFAVARLAASDFPLWSPSKDGPPKGEPQQIQARLTLGRSTPRDVIKSLGQPDHVSTSVMMFGEYVTERWTYVGREKNKTFIITVVHPSGAVTTEKIWSANLTLVFDNNKLREICC